MGNLEILIKEHKQEKDTSNIRLNAELWTNAFNHIIDEINSNTESGKIFELKHLRWMGESCDEKCSPVFNHGKWILPGYWAYQMNENNSAKEFKLEVIFTYMAPSYSDPKNEYKHYSSFQVSYYVNDDNGISVDLHFDENVYCEIKEALISKAEHLAQNSKQYLQ